jgi:hypothetical protein
MGGKGNLCRARLSVPIYKKNWFSHGGRGGHGDGCRLKMRKAVDGTMAGRQSDFFVIFVVFCVKPKGRKASAPAGTFDLVPRRTKLSHQPYSE